MCMSPSSLGNCTIYSTFSLSVCWSQKILKHLLNAQVMTLIACIQYVEKENFTSCSYASERLYGSLSSHETVFYNYPLLVPPTVILYMTIAAHAIYFMGDTIFLTVILFMTITAHTCVYVAMYFMGDTIFLLKQLYLLMWLFYHQPNSPWGT